MHTDKISAVVNQSLVLISLSRSEVCFSSVLHQANSLCSVSLCLSLVSSRCVSGRRRSSWPTQTPAAQLLCSLFISAASLHSPLSVEAQFIIRVPADSSVILFPDCDVLITHSCMQMSRRGAQSRSCVFMITRLLVVICVQILMSLETLWSRSFHSWKCLITDFALVMWSEASQALRHSKWSSFSFFAQFEIPLQRYTVSNVLRAFLSITE